MQSKTFQMTLEKGLYTKWASALVEKAMEYDSDILIEANHKRIDFKSIMGVLSLGICKDMEIQIEAEGTDETSAIVAIASKITELKLGIEKN